jgi:hypothetical protein
MKTENEETFCASARSNCRSASVASGFSVKFSAYEPRIYTKPCCLSDSWHSPRTSRHLVVAHFSLCPAGHVVFDLSRLGLEQVEHKIGRQFQKAQ